MSECGASLRERLFEKDAGMSQAASLALLGFKPSTESFEELFGGIEISKKPSMT